MRISDWSSDVCSSDLDTTEVPKLDPGIYLVGSDGKETVAIPIPDGATRLGRGFASEIQIDDPTLSRRHAILVQEDGVTTVLDDRSANGTFVNGQQNVRQRSEERRVGQECVRTCRSRWVT